MDMEQRQFYESLAKTKTVLTLSLTRPANTTPYSAKDAIGVSLTVSDATNDSPIVVTTGTHSLADGDAITISGVVGNTNANGNFYAKVTGYSATTFALYSDKALATPVAGNATYVSGGAVAKTFYFSNAARLAAGSGSITKATIFTDQTTNVDTFRLHLFNSPPAVAILDNAPNTAPLFAESGKYIGSINFPAATTEGSGSTSAYATATVSVANSNVPLAFVAGAGDKNLYCVLESVLGFTPASAQQFTIKLLVESD